MVLCYLPDVRPGFPDPDDLGCGLERVLRRPDHAAEGPPELAPTFRIQAREALVDEDAEAPDVPGPLVALPMPGPPRAQSGLQLVPAGLHRLSDFVRVHFGPYAGRRYTLLPMKARCRSRPPREA